MLPEFPDFLGNTVVHERNSHLCTWEFGKGALSASSSSLAVVRCCSRKGERESEAGGGRWNAKVQNPNDNELVLLVKNGKTSSERETRSTNTYHGHEPHEHESQCQMSRGCWPYPWSEH